jgi:hypothetical protein
METLDCDKDGNPNGTDPNPQDCYGNNDVLTAIMGQQYSKCISNDDFLPVANNVITRQAEAGGTVVCKTGELHTQQRVSQE